MPDFSLGKKTRRIMVIEDNNLTRNHIKDYLSEHGYSVIPCQNSVEALEFLDKITPDLIILDVIIPGTDGYEFCKWIRSQPRLKFVPVIFLTVMTRIEDKIAGLKIGGDDYITKPFSLEELLARIEVILQKAEHFYNLTMRDELTNVFNRRYFNERLGVEINRVRRSGQPLSVVIIDIDYFKDINDKYGHFAGDYVLVEFSRFIQNHLRKNDLTARLGGDEFILLLPDTASDRAYILIERLRKQLETKGFLYEKNGERIDIEFTFSAGVACYPEDSDSAESLLELADKALYVAKSLGKNSVKTAREISSK